MEYIIGVDGGGTKTAAAAYGPDGREIGSGRSGFGNLLLDFTAAVGHIETSVEACIAGIQAQGIRGRCAGIYLGIAGIEVGENAAKLERLLSARFHCPVRAFHDSELSHAALFKGADGIIAVSGTGSVAFGKYQGKKARTGGWGRVFGDEGSGYDIAMKAFKRAALEEDAGMEKSALTRAILENLGLEHADDLKGFAALASTGEIAALAPVVEALAKASDANAVKILKDAGNALGVMTKQLYGKLGVAGPVTIGITGSILVKVDIVRDAFRRRLGGLHSVSFVMENIAPTKGACYLHGFNIQ